MFSRIVLGVTAILYGIINLGVDWSMKLVFWGLVIFGIPLIVENFQPIVVVARNRGNTAPTA